MVHAAATSLLDFLSTRSDNRSKQLLDEVFVICKIINVEVRVNNRAEGEADNSCRDIDNFVCKKTQVQ